LSFGDPDILAGNLFSDFVKGKKKFDFPLRIQKGIDLHRAIDRFTDDHPVTAKAKQFFRPAYGLYSAVFVDVAYDHFLATDKKIFSGDELQTFAESTYRHLHAVEAFFPERFRIFFHYMQLQNWLSNYQYNEGIFRSFGGLVRRAAYMEDAKPACDIFLQHYEELNSCYEVFFPELRAFAFQLFNSYSMHDEILLESIVPRTD
jgi:acyl carrier protein phosphodiesterase